MVMNGLTDYSDMSSGKDSVTELLIIASDSLESNFEYRPQEFIILNSSCVYDSHAVHWQ
jgi:hypothetical protein